MTIMKVTMDDIEARIRESGIPIESESDLLEKMWDCASFLFAFDDILKDSMIQLWHDRERIEKAARLIAKGDWRGLMEVIAYEIPQEEQEEQEEEGELQAAATFEAN